MSSEPDEMASAVEQWLRDNPPLTNAALRSQIAALQAELAEARDELRSLIESIWKAEYRREAPEWKPLPELIGMITQIDNMYAGVRSQRDQARWDLAEAREVPGRIVAWLRGRFQQQRQHPEDQACAQFIATAIEASDWSKP